MKTIYKEIEITYDEKSNLWLFQLRGRDRSAPSLAKAKEFIDKPAEKSEKPFERVKVYVYQWHEWQEGEVTSVAANRGISNPEVWVVCNKERSKTYAYNCYPMSDANVKAMKDYRRLDAEIEKLRTQRDAVKEKMQPLEV